MKLSSVRNIVAVTYVGKTPPTIKLEKITVSLNEKGIAPESAEMIELGDKMLNNKGEVIAKIVDKQIIYDEVRTDASSGVSQISYDKTKRDVF